MKLRNKKTGEIKEYGSVGAITFNKDGKLEGFSQFNSLADLTEEWEDYEEPKGKWFVSNNGQIHNDEEHERFREERKQIGNYFETKEEAEKAVEKLKAWKWLKDNGVSLKYDKDKFILHIVVSGKISPNQWRTEGYMQKLDLLFGGEE